MFTGVSLTCIIKHSGIEYIAKHIIGRREREFLTRFISCLLHIKSPLFASHFNYLWNWVTSHKHLVPHFPDQYPSLGINNDSTILTLIQISNWRPSWHPSFFQFTIHTTSNVLSKIVDVLVSHTTLDTQDKDIVFRTICSFLSLDKLQFSRLHHPLNSSGVYGVTIESINFRTENAVSLTCLNISPHLIKERSPWCFCRSTLLYDLNDFVSLFARKF